MKQTRFAKTGWMPSLCAVILGVTLIACGKTEAQSGGGNAADAAKGAVKEAAGAAKQAASAVKGGGKPAESTDFVYKLNKARNAVIITGIQKDAKFGAHLIVPSEIEGFPVAAFLVRYDDSDAKERNLPPLETVVFPDSITYMGSSFLYLCPGLEEFKRAPDHPDQRYVTIPIEGESVDYDFDSGYYTANAGFYGCNSLKSIVFPKNIQYVGGHLSPNLNPKDIKWPETLVVIPGFGNDSTTEIVIPDGVKVIPNGAFKGLKKLSSVTIPDSVVYIGDEAFGGCPELTTVKVPAHPIFYSMFYAADGAFDKCPKLGIAAQKAIKDTGYTGSFR